MIVSMTGFGAATAEEGGICCTVEIRAVNNRFFKAVIKLPDKLTSLEPEIDKMLREVIVRGSLVLAVSVKDTNGTESVLINQSVLNSYLDQIKRMQLELPANSSTVDLATLLSLPGVSQTGNDTVEYVNTHRTMVMRLLNQAIANLISMRRREGQALDQDLTKHLSLIRSTLAKIAQLAPLVSRNYHEKLRTRVLQMVSDAKLSLSDSDLLKEVALFTDRADISEEITRLNGHLDQFQHVTATEDQAGRKIDFIAQEMLREANTIASKANDANIARHTVDIKSSIDRIKEQVQNVE